MAIVASRPTVATSATLLASNSVSDASEGDFRTRRFVLKNLTATAAVYLGDSTVTTGTGFQWDPADGALDIELEPGEALYGVVTTGTQTVHALRGGR